MGLYILLSVILLFLLILVLPVYIHFKYDNTLVVSLQVLFFKFRIAPEKDKKDKIVKRNANKINKTKIKDLFENKNLPEKIEILVKLIKTVFFRLKYLLPKVVISKFKLFITVGNEDAAKAAIEYGAVNAAVYTSFALLSNIFKFKEHDITVTPDFYSEKHSVKLEFKARTLCITLLITALMIVFHFYKLLRKKSTTYTKNEKINGI